MIKSGEQVDYGQVFEEYRRTKSHHPVFFCGDSLNVLRELPGESFDCCMTSPPY
jgi:DNA modification methylase